MNGQSKGSPYSRMLRSIILVTLIVFVSYVYVSRSGNSSLFPATSVELHIRMLLEQLFGTRPRTKEFLFGYPCIMLYLLTSKNRSRTFKLLILGGATITGISISNSFCHGFTPVIVSLQRSVGGLFLGVSCGIIALLVCRILIRIKNQL